MMDWTAASLWVHGPVAALSLGAVIKLAGESSFGNGPAERSRRLAKQLFQGFATELQDRMEKALNNYEVGGGRVDRTMLILTDEDPRAAEPPSRQTRIMAKGAEEIRNQLDGFLDGKDGLVADWRLLRRIGSSLSASCVQLRTFCAASLVWAAVALVIGGVGKHLFATEFVSQLCMIALAVTLPLVVGILWVICMITWRRNQLAPLEDRYDDLLA